MQFIGSYQIKESICDDLIELHKVADKKGLVVRGKFGKGDQYVVDTKRKDSYDLGIVTVPDDLLQQYHIPDYYMALKSCVDQYIKDHPILKNVAAFQLVESPIVQRYKPGGGYKLKHFERSNLNTTTRFLTWMTYLNDVHDGGGTHFYYQNKTIEARKGKTVIWPTDFTHTHAGIVSPTEEKYIITGWLNFVE